METAEGIEPYEERSLQPHLQPQLDAVWLGWEDSNLQLPGSEPGVLPIRPHPNEERRPGAPPAVSRYNQPKSIEVIVRDVPTTLLQLVPEVVRRRFLRVPLSFEAIAGTVATVNRVQLSIPLEENPGSADVVFVRVERDEDANTLKFRMVDVEPMSDVVHVCEQFEEVSREDLQVSGFY